MACSRLGLAVRRRPGWWVQPPSETRPVTKWQVDLSDRKRVAPVRGAAGLLALPVGQSLLSPLGLKCFSTIPHRQQKMQKDFIKMEGREVKEQGTKPTLAGQFNPAVETCPEKGTN